MISHDRRALIARLAGLALAFAPAFVVAWHVGENAVDIPVWDGWERGELLEKQHDGELAFADLYAPHIEHRMVFPRLAMLALNALTGGDVRWEIAMTFLTVIASSLCFYYLLGKALPQGRWRYLAGLAINMVLFSPLQYQNFLWAAELAFMLPLACLAFCLAVSVSQLPTVAKFGLCVLAATVGMHSFAHGILIWVAVLLLEQGFASFLPSRRWGRRCWSAMSPSTSGWRAITPTASRSGRPFRRSSCWARRWSGRAE